MKTIVVPTDFSACANNAIAYANQLAILAQARLILLHSTFVPDAMPYAGISPHATHANYSAAMHYQDLLVGLCQDLKNQNPQAQITYQTSVGFRPVTDEIAHVADKENADLIVMGTSGAHGLKEFFLGTNTADVIELTRRPVLSIPEKVTFAPIKRIVFAADLTEKQPANVSVVTALARLFDAEIFFLHLLKEDSLVNNSLAKIKYSDLYSLISYDKVYFYTQEEKDIERGIVAFSLRSNADLIVMVNHHRDFWQSVFSSSHTKGMAYHSPIPLMAIHN